MYMMFRVNMVRVCTFRRDANTEYGPIYTETETKIVKIQNFFQKQRKNGLEIHV